MKSKLLNISMEILALTALTGTLLIAVLYYPQLPERIPHRFGFDGMPTVYGGKKMIWSLPVLSGLLYTVLTVIVFFIRSVSQTEKTGAQTLRQITLMLAQLKLLFQFVFLDLAIMTVRISLGKAEGLGKVTSPLFTGLFVVVLVINIYLVFKSVKKEGS